MEIKFYFALLISLLIIFLLISFNAYFSLAVNNLEKIVICANAQFPEKVNENERFSINVYCENCGSKVSEFYSEITIHNDRQIWRAISSPYTLNPSQYLFFSTNFSLPPGIYNLSIRCFSEENYKEVVGNIEVLRVPKIVETPSIPAAPIIPKHYDVEITYPQEINVSQGDYLVFYVKVLNKGDTLDNVFLNVSSELEIKIKNPKIIAKLANNETAIFSVELNVTYDTVPKNYISYFCFVSDQLSKCFNISINVKKSELIERIENLIDFYEKVARDLSSEINKLEVSGKNVTKAKEYLEEASSHLIFAKNYLKFKFFNESLKELEEVRNYLSLAIAEVSKLYLERIPQVEKIYYAFPIEYVFYFLLLILLLIGIIYLIKKIRDYFKYRSLYSFSLRRLRL